MSSKPSVSSSGGSCSATDAGTPVRSEIVRPYSKRVIRRSGAGPGSAAHSGNVSCEVPSPPQAAANSAGRNIRAEHQCDIRSVQSIDPSVAAHFLRARGGGQNWPIRPKVGKMTKPLRSALRATGIMLPSRDRSAVLTSRSEEHTSELQSLRHLVCRLLLEKKKEKDQNPIAARLTHAVVEHNARLTAKHNGLTISPTHTKPGQMRRNATPSDTPNTARHTAT